MKPLGYRVHQNLKRRLTDDLLIKMGCGRFYWDASIGKIKAPYGDSLSALCERVLSVVNEGSSVLIYGPPYSGKTCAAVIFGKRVLKYGGSVFFVQPHKLLTAIMKNEAYDDDLSILERCETAHLLILDAVGDKATIRQEEYHLENVVRARRDNLLSTVVTTPMSVEEFGDAYPAVARLIAGSGTVMHVCGQDWAHGGVAR